MPLQGTMIISIKSFFGFAVAKANEHNYLTLQDIKLGGCKDLFQRSERIAPNQLEDLSYAEAPIHSPTRPVQRPIHEPPL
jgi:hypothetical protein